MADNKNMALNDEAMAQAAGGAADAPGILYVVPGGLADRAFRDLVVRAFGDALHEPQRSLHQVLHEFRRLLSDVEGEFGLRFGLALPLLGVLGPGRACLADVQLLLLAVLLHMDDGGGVGLMADFTFHAWLQSA